MNEYLLQNKITVITNATRDILLNKNPDALILYLFFIKQTNEQHTNQVWANDRYCKKGLKWGDERLDKAKKTLFDEDLIEYVQGRQDKGLFEKKYIKIKYIWTEEKKNAVNKQLYPLPENPLTVKPSSGFQETNALSSNNLNALSSLEQEMLKVDVNKKPSKAKQKRLLTEQDIYDLENLNDEFVKKVTSNFEITETELRHFVKNTFIPNCQANARKYADFYSAIQNWLSKNYSRKLSDLERRKKEVAEIRKDYPGIRFVGGEYDGL